MTKPGESIEVQIPANVVLLQGDKRSQQEIANELRAKFIEASKALSAVMDEAMHHELAIMWDGFNINPGTGRYEPINIKVIRPPKVY